MMVVADKLVIATHRWNQPSRVITSEMAAIQSMTGSVLSLHMVLE
jgi:hypothetical protein